jgi:hypothetical protein
MSQRRDWRERWFGKDARARWRVGARRHRPFLVLLGVGFVLRVITQIAYQPAILFIDSYNYLGNLHRLSTTNTQPVGYVVLVLRPVLAVGNLAIVAGLQHMLGLAMGVAIYALLVRLGARRWVATIATVPVLLDAYQLQIEQNIMSDLLFQALVLGAVVLLLWRRPLTLPTLAVGGAVLGVATTVRVIGIVLVVPAVAFALVAGPGRWERLRRAGVIALAFAVPVGIYAAVYRVESGRFGLNRGDAHLLYGRAATIVDCRGLDLPVYERILCPKEPLDARRGVNHYAHHSPYPEAIVLPPGKTRDSVLRDFARRVFLHQPLDLLKAVATDFGKGFVWAKTTYPRDVPVDRWQFQPEYPDHEMDPARVIRRNGGGGPAVIEPLADFLRGYQLSVGYVPGTLFAIAFIAGLLGAAGVGRARRTGLRAACALPTFCGLLVLFAADVFEFSWRYQLPAIVLAPLAGALGLTAMTGWMTPPRRTASPMRDAATGVARGSPVSAS